VLKVLVIDYKKTYDLDLHTESQLRTRQPVTYEQHSKGIRYIVEYM